MRVRVAVLARLAGLAGVAATTLSGCAMVRPAGIMPRPGKVAGWRGIATADDQKRLRDWRTAFVEGLRQARAGGHGAAVAAEGALLLPDAAVIGADLPDGEYRCRIVKLGSAGGSTARFATYPAFACRVRQAGGVQMLAKLTGSQRPVGQLFVHDAFRQVLLGTMVLGDETRAMQYGNDAQRDVAGFVERIGERRWRILLPYPRFESVMDVVEVVPG